MPNTHAKPTDDPPDHVPDWWSHFKAACTFFKATGMWPGSDHPTLGQWVVKTCASLKHIARRGFAAEVVKHGMSHDKLSALRRAKFPMNGYLPGGFIKTNKDGPLFRILAAVQNQQPPSPDDIAQLAKSDLSLKTEHRLNKLGINLRK